MLMTQLASVLTGETTTQVEAVEAAAPEFLDTASIFGLILIAGGLVVAFIGLTALVKAKRGNVKEVANIGLATLLASAILMAGLGGVVFGWATGALDFLTN